MPSIRCCSVFAAGVFFFGGAGFFFAKRLFFRYGEGCEGRASRATVGVTAKDNGGACFPLDFGITHTIGRQPSHPHRSGFFVRFMPRMSPPVSALPQPTLRGSSPSHHCPLLLFISIHLKPPPHPGKSNIPYWYCLQCTPSLILPPSSLIS